MDGRIIGWKRLGHLKLANDCHALREAWEEVGGDKKGDNFRLLRKTYEGRAGKLACPLAPHSEGGGDEPAAPARGAGKGRGSELLAGKPVISTIVATN